MNRRTVRPGGAEPPPRPSQGATYQAATATLVVVDGGSVQPCDVAATVVRHHPPDVDRFAMAVLVAIALFSDVDGRGAYPTLRTPATAGPASCSVPRDRSVRYVPHSSVSSWPARSSSCTVASTLMVVVCPTATSSALVRGGTGGVLRGRGVRVRTVCARSALRRSSSVSLRTHTRTICGMPDVEPRARKGWGRALVQMWGRAAGGRARAGRGPARWGAARRETAGAARIPKQHPLPPTYVGTETQVFAREEPTPPRPRPGGVPPGTTCRRRTRRRSRPAWPLPELPSPRPRTRRSSGGGRE